MERVVLLGAGGHFKVVVDILEMQYDIAGVTDIDTNKHNLDYYGIRVIGNDDVLQRIYAEGINKALVTLGSIGDYSIRKRLFEFARDLGFEMINAISQDCIISKSVIIGTGNAVLDKAVIHADSIIGNNVIINTGSIIEHDCIIEDYVHVSPGTTLAGGVKIGEGTHIGLDASVIQGIRIGRNCIIGAGAVVINNVEDNSVCVGVPARVVKKVPVNIP